jgi:hypothetical protein
MFSFAAINVDHDYHTIQVIRIIRVVLCGKEDNKSSVALRTSGRDGATEQIAVRCGGDLL